MFLPAECVGEPVQLGGRGQPVVSLEKKNIRRFMLDKEPFLYRITEVCVHEHYLNQLECQIIADINEGTELGTLPYTHRLFEISQGTGILAQVPWIIVFIPGDSILEFWKIQDLYPEESYNWTAKFRTLPWELRGIYMKLVER